MGTEISDRAKAAAKLLARHSQFDHHPFVAFFIDQKVAMKEKAAVLLKVSARDGLAPGTIRLKRRGPQDDVLAVEGPVALPSELKKVKSDWRNLPS